MSKKHVALTMVVVALAGCAEQAPAPVVSGYNDSVAQQPHYTLQAARHPGEPAYSYSDIEPAAGPVTSTLTSAPSIQEEQLASLPSNVTKATLPPPSIIGDVQRAPTTANTHGWKQYTVQKGDTVYRLSREFNTSPDAILKANKMESAADLTVGRNVVIPAGIGRFAKLETPVETVAQAPVEQPVAEPVAVAPEPVQAVAVEEPRTAVVTGPTGTRYKLTDEVSAKAGTDIAANAADVEPAAGPVERVTQQPTVTVLEHQVEPGETVYRIAQKYGASVIDIMGANDFAAPQDLKSGTMVKVPVSSAKGPVVADGKMPKVVEEADKVASLNTKTATDTALTDVQAALHKGKVDPVASRTKGLVWPVQGSVLNGFGVQGQGVAHTGISIKVPANTPVMASDAGTVVYADKALRTYGNLVLIRHDNGMVTAYGHNNALLVVKGEKVKKGQTVALSGNTGNVKDPQLHFEVRQNARAINPLAVLPKR